jgi:hypothetical protein
MKTTHHDLTTQLWDLLTREEVEIGHVYIRYDVDISTLVKLGSSMVEQVMDKSPYRDHIVGFKRGFIGIDIVLDNEGQAKWKKREDEIQAWCDKYGCD